MLYEIAYFENGEIVRGGIKAEIRTVGRWIEKNMESLPGTVCFAIPANEGAISFAEYKASWKKPHRCGDVK